MTHSTEKHPSYVSSQTHRTKAPMNFSHSFDLALPPACIGSKIHLPVLEPPDAPGMAWPGSIAACA